MNDGMKRYLYFDIPKQERESAISFLLQALLKSRDACELSREKDSDLDDDVHIYLAHLLFAASLPDYQDAVKRYLSKNVSDMAELIEENDDRIVRYFIYKVNADHLLVHLGLFQDLERGINAFAKSQEQYVSMAQNYYVQAADHNQRIYRRETAIGSVLGKLSRQFKRYQKILRFARKEFFHFANQFQDLNFIKFCEELGHYEAEHTLTEARDHFLDCFVEWNRTKNPSLHERLLNAAERLKRLDPSFAFQKE
ncbi:MAG: hypothetical protein A3A73_01785 [Omnitrophica bacterium RIFCSPLOWO2_01_FULL_50_24]|nr:MAG: hypothetical protein A3A73_01785 [Omnitrophica bacterium RIFCSPLOWO2_01_FULL_50_24]